MCFGIDPYLTTRPSSHPVLRRTFHTQIFSYMAQRHWNRGIIFLFNDVIRDEVLFQVPNGLRCHLIDISVSELAKVNKTAPMPLTEATFLDCLDPYFALAQNSDDVMVHGRVLENVFGKFLNEYSIVGTNREENDEMMDQVHVGTIAKFLYSLGSDVDTQERYRKPLYDMHKMYKKRLRDVGKDVELEVDSPDEEAEGLDQDVQVTETDIAMAEDKKEAETKSKKRKRKVTTKPSVVDATNGDSEERVPVETTRAKKKKKRKHSIDEAETKGDIADIQDDNVEKTANENEAAVAEKKSKKKRKKKKRKSSVSSGEGSHGSKEEEIITISFSEQKRAAKDIAEQEETLPPSEKKQKKPSVAKTPNNTPTSAEQMTSEEKRVKFGRVNHSKSYKASMKALKTVKHSPNKTPDHGILRTKLSSPHSSAKSLSKKKRRKKATDYF